MRQYYRDSDVDQIVPLYRKTFWISYKKLEENLKTTNITKLKPEADQTIPNYFKTGNYKYEIIENIK